VIDLANRYDDVSVADILAVVNTALELGGKYAELDVQDALTKVTSFRSTLENDPNLKPILTIQITSGYDLCPQ